MTENNEDTGNNIGDAVIESVQEQAAEAAEATESNDATEAMDTVEAPPAEVEAVDADPAEAPSAEEEAEVDADADYRRRLRKYTKELKELPGQWYIIQCYSGYENKVKTNLDMRAQTLEVEDSIFDVVVPVEQVIENKDGKKKLVKRKLLPGYVLVRMELNDAAWSVVRDTPGVTSFVGNEGNATPVKHRDVAKFLLPKEGAASAGEAAANAAEGDRSSPCLSRKQRRSTHTTTLWAKRSRSCLAHSHRFPQPSLKLMKRPARWLAWFPSSAVRPQWSFLQRRLSALTNLGNA